MATIDNTAWDGPAAMSRAAGSDDPAAAYEAICAGRRDGDPAVQATWALPHHKDPGDPPNADGVRNSLSRLPQTEGLTNHDAAESHLDAHMADIHAAMDREEPAELQVRELVGTLEVRDVAKREIDAFIVPWDTVVDTEQGPEMFKRGAFAGTNPSDVVMRLGHRDPPAGIGTSLTESADGARMTFKVSATPTGDEILTLAADRVTKGVSVGFQEIPGGTTVEMRAGRRTRVHNRSRLREVSTTWMPAYEQAAVLHVREEGDPPVTEPIVVPVPEVQPTPDPRLFEQAIERMEKRSSEASEKVLDRLGKLEERSRMDISIPTQPAQAPRVTAGHWFQATMKMLSGERVSDLQMRDLADLVTTDNIGVVPPAYLTELVGVIDPSRPFMQTTRRLTTPDNGMSLILPRIKTRPTVGIQGGDYPAEKAELTSTPTVVDTVTFEAVTKGGAGDISLQLLKRSSPSFLDLYLQLLAEAYAIDSEHEAVQSLVDLVGDYGGVTAGGPLDPENLALGAAWTGGFSAMKRPPNTIWMSSAAVAAFIDAKSPISNAPLYSQLQANFTAGGGVGGSISGLKAVHVPALDDQGYDVIVGPSTGFAWAEDGTYTLQIDVPAKAGRDVAIVGILWFCPIYPGAFTAYTITS